MSFSNLMMYMAMIPDYTEEKEEERQLDINELIRGEWQ